MKFFLRRPVTWLADRVSSSPQQVNVDKALSELYNSIADEPGKKGPLFAFRPDEHPVIIFSDLHKGTRDGADDFAVCEENYLAALAYYNTQNFYYLNLGDSEELWENILPNVIRFNKKTFAAERAFADRRAFVKLVGNHDLYWGNDPLAPAVLKVLYNRPQKAHMGAILRAQLPDGEIDFFCTHGHQGDAQSDGNAFSKWFVSYVWGPAQTFLEINTNSPSCNDNNKTLHNQFMYQWSEKQKNLVLITGHTHQPVFNSLTHLERLYLQLEEAKDHGDNTTAEKILQEIPRRKREYNHIGPQFRSMKPSYFNAGCCCFEDGNITGIEIADGYIRLVKWTKKNGTPQREVAEEIHLVQLSAKLNA
ncbi:metallophosphoesterase [Flavihumibacter petaseus]|nr:metallophosphoesterase [Flavihumibacter petaseus]